MTSPSLFNVILIWPILNILVAIYQGLTALHIPYALGFAIIVLTVIIKLILYPLTSSQLKASKKMQNVAPHVAKLKEKHKGDAKMLQAETMRLYKEHGINPVAGCLPVLVQLPIIWSLYAVLQRAVGVSKQGITLADLNKIIYFPGLKLHHLWDQHFFGIPLGQSPSHLLPTLGFLILLFPVATAVFQFLQSKMMFAPAASISEQTPAKNKKGKPSSAKATAGKEKPKKEDDFASAMQTQSMYVFPLMIGFFSYNFPIGLSLYWNTFTIFGIIQQYRIAGWGGLAPWIEKIALRVKRQA